MGAEGDRTHYKFDSTWVSANVSMITVFQSISVSMNTLTGSISEAVAYMIASLELHPGDLYDTSMTHSTEKMELGTESAHSTQSTTIRNLQGLYNGITIVGYPNELRLIILKPLSQLVHKQKRQNIRLTEKVRYVS